MAAPPPSTYSVVAFSPIHRLVQTISTPLSSPYLPFALPALLTLCHALRVSLATSQVQGGPRRIPITQSIALLWILLFGGWTIVQIGLGGSTPLFQPDVQLAAGTYATIHTVAIFSGWNQLLIRMVSRSPNTVGLSVDLLCCAIDAICRMQGIISLGIEPVRGHPSPLTPFLTSALIGGGGPILIGLLDLSSPSWKVQTPTWLSDPFGLMALDIWSASLVGWVYSQLTSIRGSSGSTLLDNRDAAMVGSALLFTLFVLNRLRKFQGASSVSSSAARNGKNGAGAKGRGNKASQSSGKASSATSWLVAVSAVPIALLAAQWLLQGQSGSLSGLRSDSRLLFFLAHPDDEVMFFSPVLAQVLTQVPAGNVYAVSTSIGGSQIRAQELLDAYAVFGVPSSNVIALDHALLQDGPDVPWPTDVVVQAVADAMQQRGWPLQGFDEIITFDEKGVSSHPNHKAIAASAAPLASLLGNTTRISRLTSLPLPLKYGSLPVALLHRVALSLASSTSGITPCSYALLSPRQYLTAARAMRAHRSQLLWFRYGWWTLSSYVFGGELCVDR